MSLIFIHHNYKSAGVVS